MRQSSRVRVILCMALFLVSVAQAGWFDGAEKEEPARDRRGRRGTEGPDFDPDYERDGGNDAAAERRQRLREMRKNKAPKDRDEMMSRDFNENIMRDDSVEETRTPDENADGYLSDEDINRIWSEHMHDFVPEDMMNVIVEKSSTEALFEYIGHKEPTKIKGAYYVLGGN